jgi:ribosomal-protein-alanine N-acetyltransferase
MLDEHVLIRQVRSADLRQITEIERQSFQNPWSSQLIAELMLASTGGSVLFNVAVTGDHVVGYAVAEMVGPELHLTNLAVTFQCRNRGIGCKLTRSLEDWGWKSGGEEVWLEVREHNSLAIGFYRNLGYQIRGRRKAYYHNPREDALLMSKLLIASKD